MGCSSPASLCSCVMMSPTALCAPALPFIGTCPVPSLRPQGRRGHKGGPMNALWQPGLLKSTHAPRQRVQEATPRSEPAPIPGPHVLKRHHSSDKQLAALSLPLLPMTPGAASTSLHPALLDIPSLASEIPSPNPESGGKPKPPQGPPGSLQQTIQLGHTAAPPALRLAGPPWVQLATHSRCEPSIASSSSS